MRWMLRLLSAVAVLAVLSVTTLALIPSDRIVALAAAEFTRLTGRTLQVEGGVTPSVWPVLGVETGPVTLSNAGWSDAGPMLSAEGMAIGVDLAELLGGSLRITRLELTRPDILLERAEDGVGNWVFAPEGGGAGTGAAGQARPVTLAAGTIRDGRIRWRDHATGREVLLEDVQAGARFPDAGGPLTLDLAARLAGQAVTARVDLADPAALAAGQAAPLTLAAAAGAARVAF
ncbi:MAG: hypothetical protein RIR62_2107, partial [Pseudomonadota bacterium]